ncbi:MAG: hypothetical protein RBR32_06720 [Bacteroidales bacterium]|nr:hypothetical protein [Bacteroidales bacterium]
MEENIFKADKKEENQPIMLSIDQIPTEMLSMLIDSALSEFAKRAKEDLDNSPNKYFRLLGWRFFSDKVEQHYWDYVRPQYEDNPEDDFHEWSVDETFSHLKGYIQRFKTNARGEDERKLDIIKVGMFASMLYWKLIQEEQNK